MFSYYFIRFSGPVLLVIVGLKLISGFALTGKIDVPSWLSSLHEYRPFDFVLVILFTFHAFYGLRLFLIDLGMIRWERLLFWTATIISGVLFLLSWAYFL